MIRPFSVRWVAALSLCLTFAGGAAAETVLVRHGQSLGNGWLFVDMTGRCRLVTPAHVAQPAYPHGPLAELVVLDRRGRTFEAGRGIIPDPALDLAVLEVQPYGTGNLCTRSRLGGARLGSSIDAMRHADLEVMGEGGVQRETIERVAQARADLASTITVRPVTPGFQLLAGFSGSMVLIDGRAAAMVTNVIPEANVAIALRFDEIADRIADTGSTHASAEAAQGPLLAVQAVTGLTSDLSRPPSAASGPAGWQAEPRDGRIAFELRTDGKPLRAIRLDVAGLDQGRAIVEFRRPADDTYAYVATCRVAAGRIDCPLGNNAFENLRVTIPATAPLVVSNVTLVR
jgi:hypothetical protein